MIPKNYNPTESEPKWQQYWIDEGIFKFDPRSDNPIFSIDTPPPTVSGKMHIGHVFSYSQMDFIARYHRMKGENVFMPFGTDDNGLATERLIEKESKVRSVEMDRQEFIKLCLKTLERIRPEYVDDWKRIGLSADWSVFYSTIDDHSRKVSQISFIDLYKKGREYRIKSPFMWCPECRTSIAQVELKDETRDSQLVYIKFSISGSNEEITIATTRPEMMGSCVAVYINPDDKKNKKYIGNHVILPLYEREVPVIANKEVDMEYGSGIVYHCTYGDMTDADWAKKFKTDVIEIINKDGTLNEKAGKYSGLKARDARKSIIEDLENGKCIEKVESLKHTVNTHERCGTGIEILSTYQWFIRYLDLKEALLKAGRKLKWHPDHMRNRYENWIKGLKWDWSISRQRYFGVPFPVWYCKKCRTIMLAEEKDLPVDPLKDSPKKPCKCGSIEFEPEKDVFDTWATSSLTPQIASEIFPEIKDSLYPMTLRPQAHDIISFWLFNTVVKSQLHNVKNPWKHVMVSGWALDPRGKKMSKSKGNVVEPREMIKKYSADALRFWAASSNLGEDLPFQEKDLVTGTKTINKLWNASKFATMNLGNYEKEVPKTLAVMDKWVLTKLSKLIQNCTDAFEVYEYSRVKIEAENFFWHTFTDDYLEIIKDRMYNDEYSDDDILSAKYTLYKVLLSILKLFSPIMPHITEEIYQHYFRNFEKENSIHRTKWPKEEDVYENEMVIGDKAVEIIRILRKYKSENKMSMNAPLKKVIISDKSLEPALNDIKSTMKIESIMSGKPQGNLIVTKSGIKISVE
jgi:valyl-tRNA synthetase